MSDNSNIEIIQLNIDNLTKFPMEILYHIQNGEKEFLIEYDFDKAKLPLTKVAEKITPNIIKTVQNYDIKIGISGFPRCVFERNILKPNMRWYYEDKIYFVDDQKGNSYLENKEYIKKFGDKEIKPLVFNHELKELYEQKFKDFSNPQIINAANVILDDFVKDNYYLRKRIVLLKSIPDNANEGYKERFVYYIYNRKDDFNKTFELITNLIGEDYVSKYKKFLEKSNEIVLSFALMNNNKIRKTLYFYTAELNQEEYQELKKELNHEFETQDLGGIGIDIYDNEINLKTYYKFDEIKKDEIKKFIEEFPLENKRKILPVLNMCTKPLKHVLLDYKYKNGEIFSKRIDLSFQYNIFKIHQLTNVLSVGLAELEDKEIYTLSFEISKDGTEKINFYYALKLPEEIEELEYKPWNQRY